MKDNQTLNWIIWYKSLFFTQEADFLSASSLAANQTGKHSVD